MKKRGYIGRLAVVAMVLCLITMSLTAGTLAKYASEASGFATATVAAWKVAFSDGTNTYADGTTITLKPDKTKFVDTKLVKDGLIAPEISGPLTLAVDGSGTEVAFNYTIELDLGTITKTGTTTGTCPLKFYEEAACTTEITAVSNKVSVTGTVDADAADQKATKTIYWKWVGTGDADDTTLGEDSAKDTGPIVFKIPATIKAEQKTTTTP